MLLATSPQSDSSALPPADTRRTPESSNRQLALVFVMVAVLAVVDVIYPHYTFAILFAIPLVVLAHARNSRLMWAATFVFVALTYIEYFIKYTINPPESGAQYFNFRLLNRTLVAMMMCMLGIALRFWMWSETQEPPPASHALRREQREWFRAIAISRKFDAKLASFIFPVLVIAIAATDLTLPANVNFAILYAIPLFISAWTRSRTMLWSLLAVVLALTIVGYVMAPASTTVSSSGHTVLQMNRFFSAVAMLAVTIMLHAWITSDLRKVRWIQMGRTAEALRH